jgi:hypothetical protein
MDGWQDGWMGIENVIFNFQARFGSDPRFRFKSLLRCKVIWKRITSVSVLQLSVWNMRKRVMTVSMERTLSVSITSDKVKRESLSSKWDKEERVIEFWGRLRVHKSKSRWALWKDDWDFGRLTIDILEVRPAGHYGKIFELDCRHYM